MYEKKCILTVKRLAALSCILLSMALAGCDPSEEKIAQAQDSYASLMKMHNQVVEAHAGIDDDSLDKDLIALSNQVKELEAFNLNEMTDEEIDQLVETMDSLAGSYQEYLDTINSIQEAEDAAVITPIPITLQNDTGLTFQSLELYSQKDPGKAANVLEDTAGFVPGQFLTGLMVYRDTALTPWILVLEDVQGAGYEIELSVENYTESGMAFSLSYDPELNEIVCSTASS